MRAATGRAFSLVEVAIAAAIAGLALVVVLGLLAGLAARSSDSRAAQVAAGLADGISTKLRSLGRERSWNALAQAAGADGGIALVATSSGERIRGWPADAAEPDAEAYYLIRARRIDSGPLAFRAERPVLPLQVTVAWPFRPTPGEAREVPPAQREELQFVTAVSP